MCHRQVQPWWQSSTEISIVRKQVVSGVLILSRDKQSACHALMHNIAQALSDNRLISPWAKQKLLLEARDHKLDGPNKAAFIHTLCGAQCLIHLDIWHPSLSSPNPFFYFFCPRYLTGLATRGSVTRRILASFKRRPICMLPKLLWMQRMPWLLLCRTVRPTPPLHPILVSISEPGTYSLILNLFSWTLALACLDVVIASVLRLEDYPSL